MLHEVLEMVAVDAHAKGLELICDLGAEVPVLLKGDVVRLRQVLVNLLANAVKFTHRGEISLTVELEAEFLKTATLRFRVKDTGIGFPENQTTMLFEPFVQADGSATRRYGGTGLGLTITKELVQMMGGRIGAHSVPEHGSTFWVTVTFEKQDAAKETRPQLNLSLQSPLVLVVDDNASNRAQVCMLLKRCGCRTEEASDAESAVSALKKISQHAERFQILLLDSTMPKPVSQEIQKLIASDAKMKGLALVLMVPLGQEGSLDASKDFEFAGRLSKPVMESSLYEAIGAALSAGRSGNPELVKETAAMPDTETVIKRALVVEDSLTSQQVALAMLRKLGCHAEAVENGKAALEKLQEADFDIVLLDCEMPDMDGYETARRIRSGESPVRNPKIPIIALTAQAMSGDREKCIDAGMNDYLSKPVEPEQIIKMLSKWLDHTFKRKEATRIPARSKTTFEEKELLARLSGDKFLARKITTGFAGDVPQQLQKMKQLLAQKDAAGLRVQAHTLKGAAATVAASILAELGLLAERAARDGDLRRIADLLPAMEEEFKRLTTLWNQSDWAGKDPTKEG
jgi:CheY-like chemotaxis protein/HPt (histidine-containing phosphotransfer) domain-containing protein